MASQASDGLIKEGDQVIVRIDKSLKVVPVRRNCKLWIVRSKFFLDSAIGFPYGTSFEVNGSNQKLVKVQNAGRDLELDNEEEEEGMRDNRNLTDTNTNQKLSSDEIRSMKKTGMHGEEIIEQLIQNSATFNQKNEFAKQKYIKKKKKKYVPVITVLKPTARLLLEMYYNKGPNRICNLRVDSLAQLLTQANVQSGNKMLVVESCVGLVVGAVMERLGGSGTVIQLYSGSAPVQQAVESFDFPKEARKNLHSYPLFHVNKLIRPGSTPDLVSDRVSTAENVTGLTEKLSQSDASNKSLPETTNTTTNTAVSDKDTINDNKTKTLSGDNESNQHSTSSNGEVSATKDDAGADKLVESNDEKMSEGESQDVLPEAGTSRDDMIDDMDLSEPSMDPSEPSSSKGVKRKFPEVPEERWQKWQSKQKYIQEVKEMIEKCDSDGLIVVTKYNPTPIVLNLIDFVAPSRPIAVFCQFKEPLIDCYNQLRDRGGVVLLKFSETWLRGYQVLPNRTHPKILMSGTGGYLLTGTTVELDKR